MALHNPIYATQEPLEADDSGAALFAIFGMVLLFVVIIGAYFTLWFGSISSPSVPQNPEPTVLPDSVEVEQGGLAPY